MMIIRPRDLGQKSVLTSGFHTKFGDALSGIMDIAAKDSLSSGYLISFEACLL
jgi:hypothetical protein